MLYMGLVAMREVSQLLIEAMCTEYVKLCSRALGVVMLGKVISCKQKTEAAGGGKKE